MCGTIDGQHRGVLVGVLGASQQNLVVETSGGEMPRGRFGTSILRDPKTINWNHISDAGIKLQGGSGFRAWLRGKDVMDHEWDDPQLLSSPQPVNKSLGFTSFCVNRTV